MSAAFFVAQKMGANMGTGGVLFSTMSSIQTIMNQRDWNECIASCGDSERADEVRLILGDQLNSNHSWFAQGSQQEVLYLFMEVRSETDYARHHVQKVVAFFAAMRSFANQLHLAGHRVLYLHLHHPSNAQTITGNLEWVVEQSGAKRVAWQNPDEFRVNAELEAWSSNAQTRNWVVDVADSEHFYSSRTELADFFRGKKTYRLETFYRHMRQKHGVLMDASGQPESGQWNFDASNRQKLPADHIIPPPLEFSNEVSALVELIEAAGIQTIGNIESKAFGWPITREDGLATLAYFIQELLPHFGDYQDAMTRESWSVHHSRLSFVMNVKLLSPKEVVDAVERAWREDPERISLSQAEGFIRQIIGWREYMRGIYWAQMPEYQTLNFFGHQRGLPKWFWTGETRMACLSHSIQQSLDHAYAHHIQRLMVTGNFALLAGVHPDEVDAWYLGIYIDALHWVEVTNTRGMSQFADGGIVGSKPYVSSAQYMKKMGPYCKGCHYKAELKTGEKSCPFNSLYWDFHARNRSLLERNPRIGMVYRTWDRMTLEHQQALLETAAVHLKNLNEL